MNQYNSRHMMKFLVITKISKNYIKELCTKIFV